MCVLRESSVGSTMAETEIQRNNGGDLKVQLSDLTAPLEKFESFNGFPLPSTPVTDGERFDAAAVKLQKVYKSYRTRRNLADCAVVLEELWWKALDYAALRRNSVLFFDSEKSETAVSKWSRAGARAAKVGKGLSKNEKAQKLALRHWLEAIDPRHRYGHNLHFYYDVWFQSQSSQPFFYWLDIGDGKETSLEKCSRVVLQRQCVQYLGPKQRECYEVIVKNGKLIYRQSGVLVHTINGSKWIFVLSASRNLYVGRKIKGRFQHSSFLAGGATTASGRLVSDHGVLKAIWPYSGHYRPTEENFMEFIRFLKERSVDLTNVKKCAADDDVPPETIQNNLERTTSSCSTVEDSQISGDAIAAGDGTLVTGAESEPKSGETAPETEKHCIRSKWTTGAGARIKCVREYPAKLQLQAMEQLKLSPTTTGHRNFTCNFPIPSPRPSPGFRLSPRAASVVLLSPRNC